MPLWALLYVIGLIASAVFTIYISNNRSLIYIAAELSSGILASTFFMIYYHLIPYPATVITPLLMLGFILFQEVWVNRKLYDMLSLDNIPKEFHHLMLIILPLSTILFLAPFVWIVAQVFKHYFLYV